MRPGMPEKLVSLGACKIEYLIFGKSLTGSVTVSHEGYTEGHTSCCVARPDRVGVSVKSHIITRKQAE